MERVIGVMHHEEIVAVNGVGLWTARQGTGQPVIVFCHGGPGAYDNLKPLGDMLEDNATVYRYDQRGCGRAEDKPPHDIQTFVEDLEGLRRYWGIEQWVVAGHSFGASLALCYALAYPHHTQGVLYISGTGISNDWGDKYRRNRDARFTLEQQVLFEHLTRRLVVATDPTELMHIRQERTRLTRLADLDDPVTALEVPSYEEFPMNYELNAELTTDLNKVLASDDLRQRLTTLNIPVRLIHGDGDPRPQWMAIELTMLLPYGEMITLNGVGHYPWLEHPEQIRRAMRDFLTALNT